MILLTCERDGLTDVLDLVRRPARHKQQVAGVENDVEGPDVPEQRVLVVVGLEEIHAGKVAGRAVLVQQAWRWR